MPGNAAISKQEAAELMDRSLRSVERNSAGLAVVGTVPAPNGKPAPLFDALTLPLTAQKKLIEQRGVPPSGELQLSLFLAPGQNLSPEDLARAEARYRAIEPLIKPGEFISLWEECRGRKTEMVEQIARRNGAKPRTVYDWLKRWTSGGISGLVAKDRADKGQSRALNKAASEFILTAALPSRSYGELSVKEMFRAYNEEKQWRAAHAGGKLNPADAEKYRRYVDANGWLLSSAQFPEASYETLRRFFNRIPEAVRTMARAGQEGFNNTQEIISYRDIARVQPLDYVVMDHRRLDIFCMASERGGWKLIRPWLTAAIDMRTRKWLSWVIVETPSSDSIATVLKRTFIDHGAPKAVYWDNGKDFTCHWLEGRQERTAAAPGVAELPEAWRGVMDSLGIRVHHAIVKRARSKIIEPNFTRIAYFDRTLPEWCGHKAAARPERFSVLLKEHEEWERKERPNTPFRTLESVAALYFDAITGLNERELEGDGMNKATPTGRGWMCPNEAWEILIGRVERRTVDQDLLKFCFAKRRELTVKHGEVTTIFGGVPRHYRIVGNPLKLVGLNGQKVELAYDPLDLGEAAIYCEHRFVGLAVCVELRRMGEDAFVDDERNRRAARRDIKSFIAAVHQSVPVADAETRLSRRRAVLPARADIARVETPVSVPEAVREAEAASRAEREFDFQATPIAALAFTVPADSEDDGTFKFFGEGT